MNFLTLRVAEIGFLHEFRSACERSVSLSVVNNMI